MPRGIKTCPSCQKSVGCRSRQCPCGHSFGQPTTKTEPEFFPTTGNSISTPSGKCPIPFRGDLLTWVIMLQGRAYPDTHSPKSLRYWLKSQIPPNQFSQMVRELDDILTPQEKVEPLI